MKIQAPHLHLYKKIAAENHIARETRETREEKSAHEFHELPRKTKNNGPRMGDYTDTHGQRNRR